MSYDIIDKQGKPYVKVQVNKEDKVRGRARGWWREWRGVCDSDTTSHYVPAPSHLPASLLACPSPALAARLP